MEANALPTYDMSDNPTGCCPRFDPSGWDGRDLSFQNKMFVRAKTKSIAHIPVNMGSVFRKTFKAIEEANAQKDDDFIVLSRNQSAWSGEHLFSVTKEVPGQEMVHLSGEFLTKVFEGPYKKVPSWHDEMVQLTKARGKDPKDVYFFYTTCPKCAKAHGKNYVVAVARQC